MASKKELELHVLKLENTADSHADCLAKLASEIASAKELISELGKMIEELKAQGEEYEKEVQKGVEKKWDDAISHILNYDPFGR